MHVAEFFSDAGFCVKYNYSNIFSASEALHIALYKLYYYYYFFLIVLSSIDPDRGLKTKLKIRAIIIITCTYSQLDSNTDMT